MATYIAVFDGLPIPKNDTRRVGGVHVESFGFGGRKTSGMGAAREAGAAPPTPQIYLVIPDLDAAATLFQAAAEGSPFTAARLYTDDRLVVTILKANIASVQMGGAQGADGRPRMQCEVVGQSIQLSS